MKWTSISVVILVTCFVIFFSVSFGYNLVIPSLQNELWGLGIRDFGFPETGQFRIVH